jgi:hypothetical protein
MRSGDQVEGELVLGEFQALLETIKLAQNFGGLPEDRANQMAGAVFKKFAAAPDPASATVTTLDALRELITAVPGLSTDADRALETLLIGHIDPVETEWNGVSFAFDAGKERATAYRRVIELQKAPSLAALLRMDDMTRRIAAAKSAYAPLLDALQKDFTSLPVVEVMKDVKFEGAARKFVARASTVKIGQTLAELRQKTTRIRSTPATFRNCAISCWRNWLRK